jgi:hypothetical protein
MIGWQNAGAFALLPLVLVPIVIHLLRVHRADRVLFPSLRFVQTSRSAAVHVRLPSDWLLMALRMAAVALAICAVARPIVVTSARVNRWNARTARAVVIDTSDSMRRATSARGSGQQAASEAAEAELSTAAYGRRFDADDLTLGLTRAAAWLSSTPPARRELVVVSDFQRGAFDPKALASVPDAAGVRLVQVGDSVDRHAVPGTELIGFDGNGVREQTIDVARDSTAVARTPRAGSTTSGLRFVNPAAPPQVAALLRAIAIAGTPAGSAQQPIAVFFLTDPSTAPPSGATAVRGGWMLRTVLRLKEDRALHATTAATGATKAAKLASPWAAVAGGRDGVPLVWAAALENELVFAVAAPFDSLLAATAVRSALVARHSIGDYSEQEVGRFDSSVLAAMNRPPGPVGANAWPTSDSDDGRWFWIAVLASLIVEQWLRTRFRRQQSEEIARAAA